MVDTNLDKKSKALSVPENFQHYRGWSFRVLAKRNSSFSTIWECNFWYFLESLWYLIETSANSIINLVWTNSLSKQTIYRRILESRLKCLARNHQDTFVSFLRLLYVNLFSLGGFDRTDFAHTSWHKPFWVNYYGRGLLFLFIL